MRNRPPLPSLAWNKIYQCHPSLKGSSLLLLSLIGCCNTQAVERTWIGSSSNLWNVKQNWSGTPSNSFPDANDIAIFAGTFGNGTAIDLSGNQSALSLSITTALDFSINNNTLTLANGDITRSVATGTTTINSAIALGGAALWTVAGTNLAGNLTAAGIISGGFGLEKTGGGTLTLNGANSYTGATTITAGTLLMGGSNVLPNGSAVVLAGGTLSAPTGVGPFSDQAGVLSTTLATSSIIDMGAGSTSLLFNSLTSGGGTISIWNWNGTVGAVNTTTGGDQLNFVGGVAGTDYANISFYSDGGVTLRGTGRLLADASNGGSFELTAVPEPGALFAGLALLAPLAWRERRHWMRCRDARVA